VSLVLDGKNNRWVVGEKKVAETPVYSLYICVDEAGEREYLLQIATDAKNNGTLARAVFNLGWLQRASDEMERDDPGPEGRRRNIDRLFPQVADEFLFVEQGNRRVIILSVRDVPDVSTRLYALSRYRDQGGLRLDLRSSAWIMGRLLKLLGLTHSQGIANNLLSGGNMLISPDDHFLPVFDWTASTMHDAGIPGEVRRQEIATAAQAVFASIGGDPATGDYPYHDDTDPDGRYVRLLWEMASNPDRDAPTAHDRYYDLLDELWGVKFHPFTTLPL